jgi:hypothetical protein
MWLLVIIFMMRVSSGLKGIASRLRYSFGSFPSNGKPPPVPRFDPADHGLRSDYILTNFTKMKG